MGRHSIDTHTHSDTHTFDGADTRAVFLLLSTLLFRGHTVYRTTRRSLWSVPLSHGKTNTPTGVWGRATMVKHARARPPRQEPVFVSTQRSTYPTKLYQQLHYAPPPPRAQAWQGTSGAGALDCSWLRARPWCYLRAGSRLATVTRPAEASQAAQAAQASQPACLPARECSRSPDMQMQMHVLCYIVRSTGLPHPPAREEGEGSCTRPSQASLQQPITYGHVPRYASSYCH